MNDEKAKKIFDYFYNINKEKNEVKNDVCLRVRGTKKKPEIKVYYNGIKLFDYYNHKIILNVSLFLPNNSNAEDLMELAKKDKIEEIKPYGQVSDDYKKLEEIGFKLEYANKNIDLPFSKKGLAELKQNEEVKQKANEIKEKLEKIVKTTNFTEYTSSKKENNEENPEITKYRATITNNDEMDLEKAFQLKLFSYAKIGKGIFQSLKICFRLKELNFNYSDSSFNTMMDIMKRRAKIYAGLAETYENDFSKTRSDSEKGFQQTLVSKMSNIEGRQQMANKPLSPFSENDIPFEMEYTFYASNKKIEKESEEKIDEENNQDETGNEDVRSQKNKKGRIDNIFIDFKNQEVKFVELKIDDGVIGGTNGIHKHLLDMANGLKKNTKFKTEFSKIVNNRYEILNDYGIETEYDMDIKNPPTLSTNFTFSYHIICGYTESKDIVINRFNSIKNFMILDKNVVEAVSDENKKYTDYETFIKKLRNDNTTNQKKNASNEYIRELLYFTIDGYKKYLSDECKCKVYIYVTDNEYSKFEKMDN